MFTDVYDGAMWTQEADFLNGTEHQLNLLLLVNVDWWKVADNCSTGSLGGVYVSILNLPKNHRSRAEYIGTVGE